MDPPRPLIGRGDELRPLRLQRPNVCARHAWGRSLVSSAALKHTLMRATRPLQMAQAPGPPTPQYFSSIAAGRGRGGWKRLTRLLAHARANWEREHGRGQRARGDRASLLSRGAAALFPRKENRGLLRNVLWCNARATFWRVKCQSYKTVMITVNVALGLGQTFFLLAPFPLGFGNTHKRARLARGNDVTFGIFLPLVLVPRQLLGRLPLVRQHGVVRLPGRRQRPLGETQERISQSGFSREFV